MGRVDPTPSFPAQSPHSTIPAAWGGFLMSAEQGGLMPSGCMGSSILGFQSTFVKVPRT